MLKWFYLAMILINLLIGFIRDFIVKDKAQAAYSIAWAAFFLALYLKEGGEW